VRSRHNRTSTGALLPKPSLRRVLSGDGRQGSFNRERDNPGPLGIDPYNDGRTLFKEACAVWVSSVFILASYRAELIALAQRWLPGARSPAATA